MRCLLASAVAVALAGLAPEAHAQKPLIGAFVEGGSGLEIGGGNGLLLAQRARTQLHLGAVIRDSEMPADAIIGAVVVELEPVPSIGADLQWAHRLGPLWFQAGIAAIIAPQSMFGPTAGARLQVKLGPLFSLTAGPQVSCFPIGSDVPDKSIVFQGLLMVGIHADLF